MWSCDQYRLLASPGGTQAGFVRAWGTRMGPTANITDMNPRYSAACELSKCSPTCISSSRWASTLPAMLASRYHELISYLPFYSFISNFYSNRLFLGGSIIVFLRNNSDYGVFIKPVTNFFPSHITLLLIVAVITRLLILFWESDFVVGIILGLQKCWQILAKDGKQHSTPILTIPSRSKEYHCISRLTSPLQTAFSLLPFKALEI